MAEVSVYYCFARSGGTLINRCLGCVSGNFVLSEVNPLSSLAAIESQARDWLGLIDADGFTRFAARPYGEKISFLASEVSARGGRLILRDWPTLNFLNGVYLDYFFPSGILEQEVYLDQYALRRRCAVVSRRSASVYESLRRSFAHLKDLSIDDFASAYLAYAQSVASFPVIQFEKFCEEPINEFKRLCNTLECHFSDEFVTAFSSFFNCTGDNSLETVSRGGSSKRILPLADNRETGAWRSAAADTRCQEADAILGYVR